MKNATFRQLRFFNAVARHLSFAKAAVAMHVSAPAVTMQIKDLEAEIGMPLFERQGRKVSLTTTGEYMLVYSRKMLALLKDAEDAAARLQRIETGTLTIGLVGTTTYFIPALLNQFLKEHEGIELKLMVGNRSELVQWLQNSEVDIAIMGKAPDELPTRAEPFAANPLVFVASPEHPLAGEMGLRAEDLRQQAFIVREPGSGTRSAMESFFTQARLQPRYSMELQSNDAIKQAVMANLVWDFYRCTPLRWNCKPRSCACCRSPVRHWYVHGTWCTPCPSYCHQRPRHSGILCSNMRKQHWPRVLPTYINCRAEKLAS